MTLDTRLDSFIGSPDATVETPPPDPLDALTQPDPVDEPVQVAGLTGALSKALGKSRDAAVMDVLKPLYKPGARAADREAVKVIPPTVDPVPAMTPAPVAPAPLPAAAPAPVIKAVPLDTAAQIEKDRAAALAAGTTRGKPPEQTFNTNVFDNDELAATVQAAAKNSGIDYESMSVRSIYQRALVQGVPETVIKRMLAGEKMSTKVGDSELAKSVATAVTAFDESAKKLDEFMVKAEAGLLDDAGKLEARKHMAVHDLIQRSLKDSQIDVARTMNVFKRVQDAGPGLDTTAMRAALDEVGGDAALIQFAKDYNASPTRAGKNRLLEKGLFAKMRDLWIYDFQSNLLSDVFETGFRNMGGNAVLGVLQPIERLGATVIGGVRQLNPWANPDRYTLQDNYAVTHGYINVVMDGLDWMVQSLKTGGQAVGMKADQIARESPATSDALSNLPVRMFGKDLGTTPDLNDTLMGKVIDGLGFVQSLPFRALFTQDEMAGGMASRWKLHSEAWTFANKEFDRLVAAGVPDADAIKEVNKQTAQLLTDRPADMQASIEDFRKMVTFQTDLHSFADVPTGGFYIAASKILENPFMKMIVPFNKTLINMWIEGTARTPGLNLISPRFYQDFNKGGRERDIAMSRLAVGGSIATAFGYQTLQNRFTGYGPSQTEDRKVLEALGWQPYSVVFDKDEISSKNLSRLAGITKVSVGDDKLYVSYAPFQPVSFVAAIGADLADASKFHRGGEWDEDFESLVKVGAFAAGNYMMNLPLMQGIGDLMKIGRSRSEDMGDKVVQVFDGLVKQVGNALITGTPAVGMANSSLVAHVERVMNPERSNTMPDEPDIHFGMRAFYENWQRVRSRIPGLSDGVPPALDSLGRPLESVTVRDHWVNWMPAISARTGKRSAVDELLVSLDFGIHEPPKSMDGVQLSATMFNRYKQLYGQEIKIDGMNLERYLPQFMKQAEEDALASGEVLAIGDKQKLIMSLVSKYRELAKLRMIGDPEGGAVPGDELGLPGDTIEFPDLKRLIERNHRQRRAYGR